MSSIEFQSEYRKTIGRFATGVTVILTERDGDVRGMTANAVTSVSLDPTLLLFCPSKKARFSELVREGGDFTVNILADHQESLSNYFARTPDASFKVGRYGGEGQPEFELLSWPEAGAAPRLDDCLGALGCRVQTICDGGDHWIVVGEVAALHREEKGCWPLLFFQGGYRHPSRMAREHLDPATDPYT
jgi:flavin reductase (DIM6/NTAB) family NADH-FMN oxidoreductase RutF